MGHPRQPSLFRLVLLLGSLLQLVSWLCGLRSVASASSAFAAAGADALRPARRQLRGARRASSESEEDASLGEDAPMGDLEYELAMRNAIIEPGKNAQEFPAGIVAARVVQGKDDEARELVEKGAPLEDRGLREMTALHFAAQQGNLAMVEFLVEKGAKLEATDQAQRSTLTLAAMGGDAKVVQFLIDSGADMESKDKGALTPLLWGSLEGSVEAVRCLAKAGADIEAVDADGMNAMKLAAIFNRKDVAEFLVEAGLDPKPGLALARKFGENTKETVDFLATQVSD
mmetsp:Transcript_2246/g.4556  ORF Transcript_2246/g.4556 Transcript_2246/m.4556 type:complete len:286 (+) Transcript_2246:24-881(+)